MELKNSFSWWPIRHKLIQSAINIQSDDIAQIQKIINNLDAMANKLSKLEVVCRHKRHETLQYKEALTEANETIRFLEKHILYLTIKG